MITQLDQFLSHHGKFIPVVLFVFFVIITLPGISWGVPNLWHADELVKTADRALQGLTVFDTRNFNYPSLPKYILYGLGKVVYGLGYGRATYMQAARALSVLIGGLIVILTYFIARRINLSYSASILAALLLTTSSEMAQHARFAHNDIYVMFFTTLTVLLLLNYRLKGHRLWLYASFVGVGLAATSKYNGLSLLLAVLVIFLVTDFKQLRCNPLRFSETLLIGFGLVFVSYAVGTPRMLLSMSFYVKNVLEALMHHATFGAGETPMIGLLGQWRVLLLMSGWLIFILILSAIFWTAWSFFKGVRKKPNPSQVRTDLLGVLLISLFALDLPIMISLNYPQRYFAYLLPLLAVLGAVFTSDLYRLSLKTNRRWLSALALVIPTIIVCAGFLRVLSIFLLFHNDNRIAATKFVAALPRGSSLEYTLYPPIIPDGRYKKFNYPIFFARLPDAEPPAGKSYKFNQGEAGIETRKPDYFIIDNFTYDRFDNPLICQDVPEECAFFKRLLAGETSYQRLNTFDYALPSFLPQLEPMFLNPIIQVYQRSS